MPGAPLAQEGTLRRRWCGWLHVEAPPCRMGHSLLPGCWEVFVWVPGDFPRAGSSPLLLCVGHLGLRGRSGWLVGTRLLRLCAFPCHPIRRHHPVLVTARQGVLVGTKLQGRVCPEGPLPRFPQLYRGNNSTAVPTSRGAEGSALQLTVPAGLSHVHGTCCSYPAVWVRMKSAWHFGFSSSSRQRGGI